MSFRDAERGQAIQVGAVLLFAILIIGFSTYQAVIIPADNRRVEFNHNQELQDHLAELRNAILGTSESTSTRSVSVPLGTQYPSRTLGLNPNSPSGSLRTVGTGDSLVNLTIENATVAGEAGDFWNGTARSYNTGAIQYTPNYHRYSEAPNTVYEHTILYNQFRGSNVLITADQTLIDDDRLSILTLNGSLDRTASASTSVAVRPVSTGGDRLLATAQDGSSPITLTFASRLSVDRWNDTLADQDSVVDVGPGSSSPGGEFNAIRVELDPGEEFQLGMTKAAVGQGAIGESAAYLTDVSGDGASVQPGGSQQLTLAVRDRFNNPVSGVTVNGSVGGSNSGSLDSATKTTGTDGQVTFTYSTSGSTNVGDYPINFTTADSAILTATPFDADTVANVSTTVSVSASGGGGSGGAYAVAWTDPSGESANSGDDLSSCDSESCVWDVGGGSDSTLDLNATLDPVFDGIGIEFAVSNSTVGTVSPGNGTTGSDGADKTTLTANENGTVDVLASANEGSDTIAIEVQNVTSGGGTNDNQAPTISYARAGAYNNDGDNKDSEFVKFDVQPNDNVAVDRVEMAVFDKDGTEVGQSTIFPPDQDEEVYLDPDQKLQGGGNYVDVEIVVYDTSDNTRTCTGRINNVGGAIDTNGDLDCSQTST